MKKLPLTVTILTSLQEIERLVPDWERLANQDVTEGFFRSPSWCLTWMRHIVPDATPLVMVVRDEEIVAIAPLCFRRERSGLRIISLAGNDIVCGEYLDFLSRPEYRRAALECIWTALFTDAPKWDLLSLGAIHSEGDLYWEAHKRSEDTGLMLRSEERLCPFIELAATFDEYLERFSKRRRKHFARATRIFRDAGVEVKTYSKPDELQFAMSRLIDLHTLRWNTLGKSGTLGLPGFEQFLHSLGRTQGRNGVLRLYTLEVDGVAKAAMLNFHYGTSVFQFQNGFDPGWSLARHSPGSVLVLHGIKTAIEEGRRFYDFLRGAEEYKFHFADRAKPITSVHLARTYRGKLYLLARGLRGTLARLKPSGGNSGAVNREWVFFPQ